MDNCSLLETLKRLLTVNSCALVHLLSVSSQPMQGLFPRASALSPSHHWSDRKPYTLQDRKDRLSVLCILGYIYYIFVVVMILLWPILWTINLGS